jgi:hypothetical protein
MFKLSDVKSTAFKTVRDQVAWFLANIQPNTKAKYISGKSYLVGIISKWELAFYTDPLPQIAIDYLQNYIDLESPVKLVENYQGYFVDFNDLSAIEQNILRMDYKETYSRSDWEYRFYLHLRQCVPEMQLRETDFVDLLYMIGQAVVEQKQDSAQIKALKEYKTKYEDFIKSENYVKRIVNFTQAVTTVIFLWKSPYGQKVADQVKTDITKTFTDIFSVNTIAAVISQVTTDTIKTMLFEQRNDLLKYFEKLDQKSSLDLTAVTQLIADNSRQLVNDITKDFGDVTRSMVIGFFDQIKQIQNQLNEPIKNESVIRIKEAQAWGVATVYALDKWLFKKVEK